MNKRILIVAAHPDDEILGCGGAVARLVKEGYKASTLILGEGITSRDKNRDREKRDSQIKGLKREAYKANAAIGIKDVFIYDFPDNRFDSAPLLDIVKVIEAIKSKIRPNIIFTHYGNDLNIDHRITYQAVMTATRPLCDETVKEIYSFEIPSSTEWNYPLSFLPDVFFDIKKTINIKLLAMAEYKQELKQYPHSRSLNAIDLNAKYWGLKVGLGCAEAFKIIRAIK